MESIILIAQQLAKEGKTPNTALIKSRLPEKVPLPIIIQGLKRWQESPRQTISTQTLSSNEKQQGHHLDARLSALIEAQIAPLKKDIERLNNEIKTLKEKL